jgi:hypothetical protein
MQCECAVLLYAVPLLCSSMLCMPATRAVSLASLLAALFHLLAPCIFFLFSLVLSFALLSIGKCCMSTVQDT